MKKMYKMANGWLRVLLVMQFLIALTVFLVVSFIAPVPFNYALLVFLAVAGILFLLIFVRMTTSFYVQINEDDSMRIVAGGVVDTLPTNTLKLVGFNLANALFTKDNIVRISLVSKEDFQLISKWHAGRSAFSLNPMTRLKYAVQMLQNAKAVEYDGQKGFGPHSLAFVAINTRDLVRIDLKHLKVQSFMNFGSVPVKEYDVENPYLFVSLRDHKGFLTFDSFQPLL